MPTGTKSRHERPSKGPDSRDDDMVAFGRYQLFPRLRLLLRDGVRLDVGERALDVLVQLVSTAGQVVSKDLLLSRIWAKEVVEENSLQAQNLRSGCYAQAPRHGKSMAELAVRHRDQAALLTARRLIGTSHHFLGNHAEALIEIESMLDSYTRDERHGSHFRFGMDQRVAGWAFLARILWLMGNTTKPVGLPRSLLTVQA
jgi:hypothetical protein